MVAMPVGRPACMFYSLCNAFATEILDPRSQAATFVSESLIHASQTVKWTGRDVANGVYILLDILASDVYCYGHLWPDSCSLSALLGCEHLTPLLSSFRRFCWM